MDISVLSIFTGEDLEVWEAYLAKKIPQWWENTHHKEQEIKVTSTYNVQIIPGIFLLDANKIILNKNVTVSELDDYFSEAAKEKASAEE